MALIPEEIIAQVLERCDIVETIASYVPLKPAGRNFKANCPFHNEKTPSFVVNPDKQIFHCFGCGEGGNVLSFVMKQDRLEFPEAVRMLAEKVNVFIPEQSPSNTQTNNIRQKILKINEFAADYFYRNLLSDKSESTENTRTYLKNRGITLDAVKQFQLGCALNGWDGLLKYLKGKGIPLGLIEKAGLIIARDGAEGYYDRFRNRIIFPILDTRGHCRAFGARALESSGESVEKVTAKYINSPETLVYTKGHHLYGFHLARQAIVKEDAVIIVEGYTDCLIPYQAGVKNIVASLGTALTVEQIRLLRRYTKNICLLFDMDKAGESAMLRSLDMLVREEMQVRIATLAEGDDPDSFIRQWGVEVFKEKIQQARELFDYKLNILKQRHDRNSVEGKSIISQGMLSTINQFHSAIVKSEYIKRLAQALNIAEHALVTELQKAGNNALEKKFPKQNQNSLHSVHAKTRVAERSILKLMLDDHKFIPVVKESVNLSDFLNDKIQQIITKIYEWFEQGKEINAESLINSFSDQETQKMISELVVGENIAGDKHKTFQDCLKRIKQDGLKIKIKELQEHIRLAEHAGDQMQLDGFKKEYHQLLKEKA